MIRFEVWKDGRIASSYTVKDDFDEVASRGQIRPGFYFGTSWDDPSGAPAGRRLAEFRSYPRPWTWSARDIETLIGYYLKESTSIRLDGAPVDVATIVKIVLDKMVAAGRSKDVERLKKLDPVWGVEV